MDRAALKVPRDVAPQTARASSTAETRQQLIQLLPFVSDCEPREVFGTGQDVAKRTLAPSDASTIPDKPRGLASSWSMTSNILRSHDVSALSMGGPPIALSSEVNAHDRTSAGVVHQPTGPPLDLSSISSSAQNANCSAPVNSAIQDPPRAASVSALQQYLHAAHVGHSLDAMQQLHSSAEPLEHAIPVGSYSQSSAHLHPPPPSVVSGAQASHPITPVEARLPAVSCTPHHYTQTAVPQLHQAALQRLQHHAHHPVHQLGSLHSTAAASVRPHTLPTTVVWPLQTESLTTNITAAQRYHQSAPEHIAAVATAPMHVPSPEEAHFSAYMNRLASNPSVTQPSDMPGLHPINTAPEAQLSRLSLGPLSESADSTARHPAQLYPLQIPSQTATVPVPAMATNKSPDWCVVTGLMLTASHARAPEPPGVVSVTTMLHWPPGIRAALQAGQLCLMLDPAELECRGGAILPSLVFSCPHSDDISVMSPIKGLYRCDMFHGRTDLAERWQVPLEWETDAGEVTVREMSGVRLVLSRHGFSLLPSAAAASFLVMQSLMTVLGSPLTSAGSAPSTRLPYGKPAMTSAEATHGRLLLWEVIRSATHAASQLPPAPREPRAHPPRAPPVVDASRGGWLQRLNHEKQKQDLAIEWHDRQLSDLTWISTLLVNGAPVHSSDPCVKKQDARDGAARAYLTAIGSCD